MKTVHLSDYVELLRRRWLTVVVCLLLGTAASLAYLQWAPKSYRATTRILVTPIAAQIASAAHSTSLDTDAQIVISTGTATGAAAKLHVASSHASELAQRVTVTVPPNTRILLITYAGPTPEEAQRGSLAFAQAYLDQRQANEQMSLDAENKTLQARIDALDRQLQQAARSEAELSANSLQQLQINAQVQTLNDQLTLLASQQNQIRATSLTPGTITGEPALPSSPSSPNRLVTLSAGLLLGLLAGVPLAALRHRGNETIRGPHDVFRLTGLPVAAVLSAALRPGEVTILPTTGPDGRCYARLRNQLAPALAEAERPVTLVAGVRHGGGPVAANLAVSLARAGRDVYLLCADASTDSAAALLGAPGPADQPEVLVGGAAAARSLPGLPQLRVLPERGNVGARGLLPVRDLRAMIDEMVGSGAAVVIEAPATSSTGSNAQTLATLASVVVLVVEDGKVTAGEVLDARRQFEAVGTPVAGAVVARYGRARGAKAVRTHLPPEPSPDSRSGELVPPAAPSGAGR